MSDIETRIREIIAQITKIPINECEAGDNLVTKYGIDSMQRIEIVIALEKAFEISVSDQDAQSLRTLLDFVSLVDKEKGIKL